LRRFSFLSSQGDRDRSRNPEHVHHQRTALLSARAM
jgi:hypothetical protein